MNPIDRDVDASTADEFMGRLSPLHPDWRDAPRDWIFRGVPDAERHTLVPCALRTSPAPSLYFAEPGRKPPSSHSEQVDAEFGLLSEFFRVANGQGLLIPKDGQIHRSPWAFEKILEAKQRAMRGEGPWPFDAVMSLAALAQHHGVPTRLLDWSSDPFAAAYFAATQAADRLHRHQGNRAMFCGGGQGSGIECPGCGATTDVDPSRMGLAVWALNWRYVWKRWPATRDIDVQLVMAPRATNPNLHMHRAVCSP
jgi:hypothetical protein